MKLNNIILVPTDFSEVCHNAIDHAVKIAALRSDMKVCIYHVINKDTQSFFKGLESLNEAVAKKLQGLIDEFRLNYDVEMEYAYEEGSIFDLIHKKAEEIGANFIILGTHGKKGFQHLLGSFALKVLTQAQVPTLVIQNKEFLSYKNVLFPVTSFTEARQKILIAMNVARNFNATIHIFKQRVQDVEEMVRIENITNQIIEKFKTEQILHTITTAEYSGDSPKQLMKHAASNEMDLIMILTEPDFGSSNFKLGPWNEKIMFNEEEIPVLCINPVEDSSLFFNQ